MPAEKLKEEKTGDSAGTNDSSSPTPQKNVSGKLGKKGSNKKKSVADDPNRFEGAGVDFKAKLIGVQEVAEARGDQMCQEALHMSKTMVKASHQHKQRIFLNISLEGLKIKDEKSTNALYSFPVSKISFIARDVTDDRAFGFIFGDSKTKYKFYGIKTAAVAESAVLSIRDMFHAVYEIKKKEVEMAKERSTDDQNTQNMAIETNLNTDGVASEEPVAVADLVDLQCELENLQEGMNQMESAWETFPDSTVATSTADSFFGADLLTATTDPMTAIPKHTTHPITAIPKHTTDPITAIPKHTTDPIAAALAYPSAPNFLAPSQNAAAASWGSNYAIRSSPPGGSAMLAPHSMIGSDQAPGSNLKPAVNPFATEFMGDPKPTVTETTGPNYAAIREEFGDPFETSNIGAPSLTTLPSSLTTQHTAYNSSPYGISPQGMFNHAPILNGNAPNEPVWPSTVGTNTNSVSPPILTGHKSSSGTEFGVTSPNEIRQDRAVAKPTGIVAAAAFQASNGVATMDDAFSKLCNLDNLFDAAKAPAEVASTGSSTNVHDSLMNPTHQLHTSQSDAGFETDWSKNAPFISSTNPFLSTNDVAPSNYHANVTQSFSYGNGPAKSDIFSAVETAPIMSIRPRPKIGGASGIPMPNNNFLIKTNDPFANDDFFK